MDKVFHCHSLYLIFLIWVKSWWGLIVVPFIFDIYITKRFPGRSGRNLKPDGP